MRNNWVKTFFVAVVCFFMYISIVFTALSGILMAGMDRIVYAESNEQMRICEVDLVSHTFRTRSYSVYGSQSPWQEIDLSSRDVFKLKLSAAFAKLPLWLRSYGALSDTDNNVLWTIELQNGSQIHRSAGSNELPMGWKMVIPQIERFAEEAEKKAKNASPLPGDRSVAEI